jgi:hypothetical protein
MACLGRASGRAIAGAVVFSVRAFAILIVAGPWAEAVDTDPATAGPGTQGEGGVEPNSPTPELRRLLTEGGLITDAALLEELGSFFVGEEGGPLTFQEGWFEAGRAIVPLRPVLEFRWGADRAGIALVPWEGRPSVRALGPRGEEWFIPLTGGGPAVCVTADGAEKVPVAPPARERDGTLFVPLRFLIDHFGVATTVYDELGCAEVDVYRLEVDGGVSAGYCPMRPTSKAPPPPKEPDPAAARATIIRWLDACQAHDWDLVDRLTADEGSYFVDLVSYKPLGRRKGYGWYSLETRSTVRNKLGVTLTAIRWIDAVWDADTERWSVSLAE